MFTTLIAIIIVVAAFALLYWGLNQLSLPPTIKTVILVVLGLVALAVIYHWVIGGGLHLPGPG